MRIVILNFLKALTLIFFVLPSSQANNAIDTRFTLVNRSAEPIFKLFISP